jgi:hypothetical protein
MVTLTLDPEVEAALRYRAVMSDSSVDEVASMVLSRLILDED